MNKRIFQIHIHLLKSECASGHKKQQMTERDGNILTFEHLCVGEITSLRTKRAIGHCRKP